MPALPSVPNALKAGFIFGQSAGEALGKVALHFAYTGGTPDVAAVAAIATAMQASLGTHVAPLTPSSIDWSATEVTDLSSPTGASSFDHDTAHPGTRSGNTPPLSVCVLTLYDIARRYRGGHPRSYWPLGTEADFGTILNWSGSFITAVDAGISAHINACLAATGGTTSLTNLINISYFHGSVPFTEPSGRVRNIAQLRATPVVDVISYKFARDFYASQRKRRGKV